MTRKSWLWLLLIAALAALILVCAFYLDATVQAWIAQHQNRSLKLFMRNVSRWGDWPAHVVIGLAGLVIAYWRGRRKWMRIFLAMLLACALAGLAARAVKIAAGRARPSVKTESVWNGPRLGSKYNAFPSGHTAASTAFFAVLFLVGWRLGLACLPIPLLIAASRLYVGAHYFSDVMFAAILGALCAFVVGNWLLLPIQHRQPGIKN